MISFDPSSRIRSLLCLGAHCDDIEIGAGGAVLKMLDINPEIHVRWVVFSSNARREAEARSSADVFLRKAKSKEIIVKSFRDGFFPFVGDEIKETFEAMKRDISPDVILTHYRDDLHQDHRTISSLTWNTFRDHFILEYEIPKYDGDLGRPNLFVKLPDDIVSRKIKYLQESFPSQAEKHWFADETFRAILRLRGVESACRYAEAFHCRKFLF